MQVISGAPRSFDVTSKICASLAFLAAFAAAPVSAQISETVSIDNNFGVGFDPQQTPSAEPGGTKETVYRGNYTPSTESELGLNYTATADTNGFFFLHDNYCVGACSTVSDTTIVFTVTNTGDGQESVRFDSQITPGHLAKIYNGSATAGFNFEVLRSFGGSEFSTLYSASGTVGPRGISLETGNLQFNGLNRQTGTNFDLLDWDTTNLSVDIGTLSGFESVDVIYRATYWSINDAACADVFACNGAQVVFGDPRNNGGTNLGVSGDLAPAGRAVIGADYGAAFVPFAFVRSDADPSFPNPAANPPLAYDPLYRSRLQAVPEPASWALMLMGFGALGSAVRRQKGSRTVRLSI
jgi:hypothetical protein